MFDLLGMGKVDSKEAIQEIMCGATRGLFEGFYYQIQQRDEEIARLKEKINQEKTWEVRYKELSEAVLTIRDTQKKTKTEKKEADCDDNCKVHV